MYNWEELHDKREIDIDKIYDEDSYAGKAYILASNIKNNGLTLLFVLLNNDVDPKDAIKTIERLDRVTKIAEWLQYKYTEKQIETLLSFFIAFESAQEIIKSEENE